MKIPLDRFEQVIDSTILERGLLYFKKGHVTELTEIDSGVYEAIVEGTDEYTITLEIANNIIEEHNCNCPYDMGPVCKHLTAVIFSLQQDIFSLNEKNPPKARKKRTKSVNQQIKELLTAISHEELMGFIAETSKSDKKFRNIFLTQFAHLSQDQSKAFYQKQIKSILNTAARRDNWIDWSDMKYVVRTTEPFLTYAKKYLESNNFENVFYISTALLEEFTEAFQYADDSGGDLGYFIDSSMELLYKLTKEKLSKILKNNIFDYCISTFKKGLFSGWDWHLGILNIACELIEKESDADTIIHSLDTVEGEYERERAQFFKLDLLRRFKSEKEIKGFVNAYISNSKIREGEIAIAFKTKDYVRAIALSKDGIRYDEQDRPGLAKQWYDWLLKIAQTQNDIPKIIEYARFRLINSFHGTQDYYQILKNTIDDKDWDLFLEEIIEEITPKRRWNYTELRRKIYINEQWWQELFSMVKQNVSLTNIEQNEEYLSEDYASELIELYGERITIYIDEYVGRSHYKKACRYLRRMKKLGGKDRVNTLIEMFRKKYPHRRALMDELSRV